MRKIILTLSTVAMLFTSSCLERYTDPCKDLNCGPNSTCDGLTKTCDCDLGWEGTTCTTETRVRFLGNYQVSENCSGTINNYTCIVGTGFGPLDITINPIKGATLKGTVASNNGIEFQTQSSGGYVISGTGNLNGNIMTLNLTFDPTGFDPPFNCSFTLTK